MSMRSFSSWYQWKISRKILSKGILFFLFFGFSPMLNAQQQQQGPPLNFDQFKKSIEEIESIDEKIDHYLQASVQFSSRIPDSVFALANEVRQMEGLKTQEQDAFYYFILANAWRTLNK